MEPILIKHIENLQSPNAYSYEHECIKNFWSAKMMGIIYCIKGMQVLNAHSTKITSLNNKKILFYVAIPIFF